MIMVVLKKKLKIVKSECMCYHKNKGPAYDDNVEWQEVLLVNDTV